MISRKEEKRLEEEATAFLLENDIHIRPTNRSIRADGLIYLDAIAGHRADQLEDVIENELHEKQATKICKRLQALPSLLAVTRMTEEEQRVVVNYVFQDLTFRALEKQLKTGGKSKYHMLYQKATDKLRIQINQVLPLLQKLPEGVLLKLEEATRKQVTTNIVRIK